MDNQHQLFLKELLKIGLIKAETLQIYLNLFTQLSSQQDLSFKVKQSQCLNNYLHSISQNNDYIKAISLSITNFCCQQISQSRDMILLRLIKVKAQIIKKITLRKWQRNCFIGISTHRIVDLSASKITLHQSSRNRHEDEELKECTFQPRINTTSLSCFGKCPNTSSREIKEKYTKESSVYSRLYTDFIRMNLKKEMRKSESDRIIGENMSFYPQTNSNTTRYKRNANKSFNERQQNFNEYKTSNKDRMEKCIEYQYKLEHTFNPATNKKSKEISNKRSRSISASNKKKEELSPHMKDCPVRFLDYKRIQNLYQHYKIKGKNLKDLQRKTDEANGFTYQPNFINDYKPVRLTKALGKSFIKRNEQFVNDKTEFIVKSNEEHFSYQKKQHSYSTKEKQQIAQNIIERLYDKGLQKIINRNYSKNKESTNDNSKQIDHKNLLTNFILNPKGITP